jgi:hypothetical protein
VEAAAMQKITIQYICDPCLKDEVESTAIIGYKTRDDNYFHACSKHEASVIEFDLERWPIEEEVIKESTVPDLIKL